MLVASMLLNEWPSFTQQPFIQVLCWADYNLYWRIDNKISPECLSFLEVLLVKTIDFAMLRFLIVEWPNVRRMDTRKLTILNLRESLRSQSILTETVTLLSATETIIVMFSTLIFQIKTKTKTFGQSILISGLLIIGLTM